ncbi:MAG TPA: glycosyltransferase [Candidatus Nanoarchaeia archaeon]|nr:glycosyltransferase [Candidatus Nanoarchaeia archaeon]
MITFVLPIYNGAHLAERNLKRLCWFLTTQCVEGYEILLVNDGSTDNLEPVVSGLFCKNVRLIGYPKNKGKGYAIKYAANFVSGDIVVMMDADLPTQIDLHVLYEILHNTREDVIVIGSRYLSGALVKRKLSRFLLSKTYWLVLKILFPSLEIRDTDFGLKAFTQDNFIALNKNVREERWSWDLELLLLARRKGMKIKEVPVSWEEDEDSTFGGFKGPLQQFITTVQLRMRY